MDNGKGNAKDYRLCLLALLRTHWNSIELYRILKGKNRLNHKCDHCKANRFTLAKICF